MYIVEFPDDYESIKLRYPVFHLDLMESKKRVQYLNTDGFRYLETRKVYYSPEGRPQLVMEKFSIGTLYDLILKVDSSQVYNNFFSHHQNNQYEDDPLIFETRRKLKSECPYMKVQIYKDNMNLYSIMEFICYDEHPSVFAGRYHQHPEINVAENLHQQAINNRFHATFLASEESLPTPIKIQSYNIWNYNAPWRKRRTLIADILASEYPDIIAFQELRYSPWESELPFYDNPKLMGQERNQVQHIWNLLCYKNRKYHYIYLPSMVYQADGKLEYEGLGIFSKFPIIESSFTKLSRDYSFQDDNAQRSVLRAFIETPNGPINIFTSHFSLDDAAKERNAYEVFNYTRQFPKPHVFLGDLNSMPNSNPIQFLTGKHEINGEVADFDDMWVEYCKGHKSNKNRNHPNNEIETCINEGWTYPTLQLHLDKRIDYIMKSGDNIKLSNFKILGSEPSHSDSIFPSDHSSIQVTLTFNKE
eukprot:gene5545-6906_t